jgi:hypothetical protein
MDGNEGEEIYGAEQENAYLRDGTQQLKPAARLRRRAGARPTLATLAQSQIVFSFPMKTSAIS